MGETKQSRGDVNFVRNQTDGQAGRIENTPEDIVVPVKFAWTTVRQMREAGRARFNGLSPEFPQMRCVWPRLIFIPCDFANVMASIAPQRSGEIVSSSGSFSVMARSSNIFPALDRT